MSQTQTPNIVIAGFTGDRSGSMCSMNNAPSDGLFSWINDQKKSVKDNSQVGKLFVSTFDDEHDVRIDGENIADVDSTLEQCREWMHPRSMTKLYDSAIDDLDRLIQAKANYEKNMPRSLKALDPKIVIVWACMTDGDDNSSIRTMEDFKNKVKEAQDVHGMKCFFLGANQDAVMTGQQYGFQQDCSLTFGATDSCAENAMRSVGQVMRQASSGSQEVGFTQNMRVSSAPPPSHQSIPLQQSTQTPSPARRNFYNSLMRTNQLSYHPSSLRQPAH